MTTQNTNEIFSGKAVYTNTQTGETYTLAGVEDLGKAWNMVAFAARRNDWNVIDVKVSFIAKK